MTLPESSCLQILSNATEHVIVEESFAAMCSAVYDLEFHGQAQLFVPAMQLVCLIDGHLRVLIAVDQQQRRVRCVNVSHRAGQFRKIRLLRRLSAQ